jgi:hypothetical protein
MEHFADAWPLCTSLQTISEIAGLVQKQRSRTPISGLQKLIPEYEHTFAIRDEMRGDGGLYTPP